MLKGAIWRFLLAVLALAPASAAAQSEADYERIRQGTVFIRIDGRIQDTGRQASSTASGYFIDNDGHILTAQHILFNSLGQGRYERFYAAPELCVIVGSSDLNTNRCHPVDIIIPPDLSAVDLSRDFALDVAVLRLRSSPEPVRYTPLAMCAQYAAREGSREEFTAYGFPPELGFLERHGPFDGQNGRVWQTNMQTTHGMSGGPVVNTHGDVVGLVSGGETSGLYSNITPLRYAGPVLHGFTANLNTCRVRATQPVPSPRPISGSCENGELDSLARLADNLVLPSERDAEKAYVMYRALACNDHARARRLVDSVLSPTLRDACAARVVEDLLVKGRAGDARNLLETLQIGSSIARGVITRMVTRGTFDAAAEGLLSQCPVPEEPNSGN